jgi:TatA/E family protein of Tat protein translocase
MIGPQDIWVALALGIFFFGAKKLPELSRSLGQALSEFKKGVAGTEAGRARSAVIRCNAPSKLPGVRVCGAAVPLIAATRSRTRRSVNSS